MKRWKNIVYVLLLSSLSPAQEMHDHGVPERLGTVSFPISCAPAVQPQFNRAVALLHSFAYAAALQTFQSVATQDPTCAMAHWGEAMSTFHPVWSQPLPHATFDAGRKEILTAQSLKANTDRERQFIHALSLIYADNDDHSYNARADQYEHAMSALAASNRSDTESQIFYALALLGNASPADMTHEKQKQAVDILQPINAAHPDHPGVAHYLIHACDNQELAQQGLPAARAYAQIAPSVPHALHMPSHIFTRLGLWDDSIQSNLASRQAAHLQGNVDGELHAMDYLVYAYLQLGRDAEAKQIIQDLEAMQNLDMTNFTIVYAASAIPIRYLVERGRWAEAANVLPTPGAPPEAAAIAIWSKGLGLAHQGHPVEARAQSDRLMQIAEQLHKDGKEYWSRQTFVLAGEVMAWSAQASGELPEATTLLRTVADQEDALEKLPVTPGPILPAREQLGTLLFHENQSPAAHAEFQLALKESPGRLGALQGLSITAETPDPKK